MIDYKLAKQLKDAGFPQKEPNEVIAFNTKKTEDGWIEGKLKDVHKIYAPTLSELIEACGRPIFISCYEPWCYAKNAQHSEAKSEKAKTPEEAVAKLWLKLND